MVLIFKKSSKFEEPEAFDIKRRLETAGRTVWSDCGINVQRTFGKIDFISNEGNKTKFS